MSGSLEQPFAKLGRAAEHFRTIKEEGHFGVDRKMRAVRAERHREGLEYRFYIGEIEPLAPELPLILGDAYHNLRASLDYLVYQLHVRRFRGVVPRDAEFDSAFPVKLSRTDRWGKPIQPPHKWKEIKRLGRRERTAIEWLQPYHRRNCDGIRGLRQAVRDIHLLNVIDKHRQLHLVDAILVSAYTPNFEPRFGFRQDPAFGVPLVSNARVDTWTFTEAPPPDDVDVYGGVYTAVGIEPESGDRIEVIPHLGGCILSVDMILKRFARRFPVLASPLDLSWVRMKVG